MAISDNFNNIKNIGLYSFDDDGNGNIQIYFKINQENYKLIISKKDLKCMNRISALGKMLQFIM